MGSTSIILSPYIWVALFSSTYPPITLTATDSGRISQARAMVFPLDNRLKSWWSIVFLYSHTTLLSQSNSLRDFDDPPIPSASSATPLRNNRFPFGRSLAYIMPSKSSHRWHMFPFMSIRFVHVPPLVDTSVYPSRAL